MRRLITLSVTTAVLLVLAAQPVAAGQPQHERFTDDATFQENLCGVDVTTRVLFAVHLMDRSNGVFMDHVRGTITHTNAEGDWLQTRVAGVSKITETLNPDGTLTVVVRQSGLQSRWRSSEGITAAFDRGRIIFTLLIDLNDPEDPEDDELLSISWTFSGPHPEADSNFELFCEVVNDVLG